MVIMLKMCSCALSNDVNRVLAACSLQSLVVVRSARTRGIYCILLSRAGRKFRGPLL